MLSGDTVLFIYSYEFDLPSSIILLYSVCLDQLHLFFFKAENTMGDERKASKHRCKSPITLNEKGKEMLLYSQKSKKIKLNDVISQPKHIKLEVEDPEPKNKKHKKIKVEVEDPQPEKKIKVEVDDAVVDYVPKPIPTHISTSALKSPPYMSQKAKAY